jgi:hypothetical protein
MVTPVAMYDGVYAVSYAIFALRGQPTTGPSIARAFDRLISPGSAFGVGPSDAVGVRKALATGNGIDLRGAASEIDFDRATGEVRDDFALFCPAVDPAGRASGEDVASGLVVHAPDGRVSGAIQCP